MQADDGEKTDNDFAKLREPRQILKFVLSLKHTLRTDIGSVS